ncbi:MAG: DUF4065 domain-containing protein [Prevotellaceae bacterium]|nr:DUF4065 domain-containing protein [Prevotellaceae bacterium]
MEATAKRENALSIANCFVSIAKEKGEPIRLLGLIKRVYIAHGFSLAIYNEPLLDRRFDRVEAWRYGPVIPSVYHSFKHYKDSPITEGTVILKWNEDKSEAVYESPEVRNEMARRIVKMVYERYRNWSDSALVSLTHRDGTPWRWCYKEGENAEIPDFITKAFYRKVVDSEMKRAGYGG